MNRFPIFLNLAHVLCPYKTYCPCELLKQNTHKMTEESRLNKIVKAFPESLLSRQHLEHKTFSTLKHLTQTSISKPESSLTQNFLFLSTIPLATSALSFIMPSLFQVPLSISPSQNLKLQHSANINITAFLQIESKSLDTHDQNFLQSLATITQNTNSNKAAATFPHTTFKCCGRHVPQSSL